MFNVIPLILTLASPAPAPAVQMTDEQMLCASLTSFAEAVMESRQNGIPISMALTAAPDDNPAGKFMRKMILDAYMSPRFTVESVQQEAIKDFRDNAETACYMAMEARK